MKKVNIKGNYNSYKRNLSDFLLLLFISPALALLQLINTRNQGFLVVGSTLMMGLFGALFSYSGGSDAQFHYKMAIQFYSDMSFTEYINESWHILIQSPNIPATDLYIHSLSFLSSALLQMPKTIHVFAGFILGYYIIKSLLLVFEDRLMGFRSTYGVFLLLTLLLIHTISLLNAIRIGTAVWMLFYGAYGFYKKGHIKYLFIILLATQVHLAIGVMAIPALAAIFVARNKFVVISIWAVSFLFQLTPVEIKSYLPQTDVIEHKTKQYVLDENRLNEFQSEKRSQELNWYTKLGPSLHFNIAILIVILSSILAYLKIREDHFVFLFSSTLLFYSFANIVDFVPSLQGRLMNCVSIFLLMALIYLFVHKLDSDLKLLKSMVKFGSISFLILSVPLVLKNFSHVLVTTEVFFLALPLISIFLSEDYSFRDLLGDIV